jgi:EAL domain-containing protein (putative c-di-GMP-specific phosphodiesterase class I)
LLVIESIVDVARKLKIKVVAEFVSDEAIADKLKSMGVDYLQGFYYGAPKAYTLNAHANTI